MDVRTQALSYSQIINLYGALIADINRYNNTLDEIGEGMQKVKANMSSDDRHRVSQFSSSRDIKQYGKLFNKCQDEETAEVQDRFESRHQELVRNGDTREFKMKIPKSVKGLDSIITEELWDKTSNEVKLEIERIIRNQLYYVSEAMLSAINSSKYNGRNSYRHNQQLYSRKNKAIVNFLVKLYEANELLEPNEQQYAGISEDENGEYVISTISASVHFGNDANMLECLKNANAILKKGRENEIDAYDLVNVTKNFRYDIPRYVNNTGLVSYANTGNISAYVTDLKARVLARYSKAKGIERYKINYSKLKEYINTVRAGLNDREIFHIIDRLNREEHVPVFGRREMIHVIDLLNQRKRNRNDNRRDEKRR